MSKYYAYVALNGEIIVHPYNRLEDITSCYTSGSVIEVLPHEFEAKNHNQARQVAYKIFKKMGREPKKPVEVEDE